MAPRPYWSGHVRLSLVTFAVRLYPAIETRGEISFRQIHKPSGERIRYQKVVPDLGPVDRDEIVKGFEYEKGEYVLLEDEELAELKLESSKTIELVQFVESGEIDAIYFDRPYFLTPDGKLGEEAYRIVRDALKAARKVALGQVVLSGRERIAAIRPCGRGLVLETLRYAEEIREADAYFEGVGTGKGEKEQLELAQSLIEKKSGPFEPEQFHDRYKEAVQELVREKLAGRKAGGRGRKGRAAAEIVDLTEALKRSVAGKGGDPGGSSGKRGGGKGSASSKRKSGSRAA
ncbi:Ku protein [Geminicoccaceae bacterium 1502E]|nr:Ku protein [Geminicoccaceae bacterium 1502E]